MGIERARTRIPVTSMIYKRGDLTGKDTQTKRRRTVFAAYQDVPCTGTQADGTPCQNIILHSDVFVCQPSLNTGKPKPLCDECRDFTVKFSQQGRQQYYQAQQQATRKEESIP